MKLGIDIGSKTIKLCLIDEDGTPLFACYERHMSSIQYRLQSTLRKLMTAVGDQLVTVAMTGSASMGLAPLLGAPFIHEVSAMRTAVLSSYPDADVVLEMGGEDTKLIYLTGRPEERMNTVCAGGTGGFIDLMAGMMGEDFKKMDELARGATRVYPIASRCAVFAKSDIRPLLNAGVDRHDIAASVLQAVCRQAIAGMSCGRPIRGKVLLLGGPFEHIPSLRKAFCDVSGLSSHDAIVPENAHLFVAMGAALCADRSEAISISSLREKVLEVDVRELLEVKSLPPLFGEVEMKERQEPDVVEEWEERWGPGSFMTGRRPSKLHALKRSIDSTQVKEYLEAHDECHVPRRDIVDIDGELFLGVDAGSTTMKVALIDDSGALVQYKYEWNEGDVVWSLKKMLHEIYRQIEGRWTPKATIRRCCIVGYGENFCKAAFGIDYSEVETLAHLEAARELVPDLDCLIDIGGQDIKFCRVSNGLPVDIVLNEACSSGCGSLFDSVARSLRLEKFDLVGRSLRANNPIDLGARCTVFMESRIKHAQKDGANLGDIGAGIAYSTARNALQRVIRDPKLGRTDERIVVQGGALANNAILRAFELELGRRVIRPDLPEIMGAWGAALIARKRFHNECALDSSAAASRTELLLHEQVNALDVRTARTKCGLCNNACNLAVSYFNDTRTGQSRPFVAGNRCPRGAEALGVVSVARRESLPDAIAFRNKKMDELARSNVAAPHTEGWVGERRVGSRLVVGIPRALGFHDSAWFWVPFFQSLGISTVLSGRSSAALFDKGMEHVPSESACYPFKLLFGHVVDVLESGADVVFCPMIKPSFFKSLRGGAGDARDPRLDCPLVIDLGGVLGSSALGEKCMISDLRRASTLDDIIEPLHETLLQRGIEFAQSDIAAALQSAYEAYAHAHDALRAENEAILDGFAQGAYPGALVIGHAYHVDSGINHEVNRIISELGYAVIDGNALGLDLDAEGAKSSPWNQNAESLGHLSAALEVRDNLRMPVEPLQVVILSSFGCSIDASTVDLVKRWLNDRGVLSTIIKVDDVEDLAAVRIRLRSLAYANRERSMVSKEGRVD